MGLGGGNKANIRVIVSPVKVHWFKKIALLCWHYGWLSGRHLFTAAQEWPAHYKKNKRQVMIKLQGIKRVQIDPLLASSICRQFIMEYY